VVKSKVGDQVVTVDRRREVRRKSPSERAKQGVEQRRKQQRRRHIDPTTCERDYSQDELEFMRALDDYKRSSGRMFPTCSEILEVVRSLGYIRPGSDTTLADGTAADTTAADEVLDTLEQLAELGESAREAN
jgi:hypothetical protein